MAGLNGTHTRSAAGSQCANWVWTSVVANQASTMPMTWPKPNGTAAGYSSATGHSASNRSAPWASGTNQLLRNRAQRLSKPARCISSPSNAPKPPPAELSSQSTLEGTRLGRYTCNASMSSDNREGIASALIQRQCAPCVRSTVTARKKPSGT